jgi:hypothetical protein
MTPRRFASDVVPTSVRYKAAVTVLLALVGLIVVPTAASAAHPCPQSADGSPPQDPSWTSDHDACTAGGLGPAPAGDVSVTAADAGTTVTVPLGHHLRVALNAGDTSPIWNDIDAGPALHRDYLDVQRPWTSAIFAALQATDGEQVIAAEGPTAWSIRVVVPAQQDPSPAPAETCQPQRVWGSSQRAVALTEADNGRTVQVTRGDVVGVFFPGCNGFDFRPAVATAPLHRYRAHGHNPGGAAAVFNTPTTGTATITSTTDAPCFHSAPACAAPQQQWQVTVQVVEPCRLDGLANVPAGSQTQLVGRFTPNANVQIWFRPYGGAAFAVRRTMTADGNGDVFTSFRSTVDQRWYATTDQSCTTAAGLTQVSPYVSGPTSVRRGTTVPVAVHGPAGASVGVWFKRAGGQYSLRRTGRLDGNGGFGTSYVADADYAYYAVTGPDRRTTAPQLTTAR